MKKNKKFFIPTLSAIVVAVVGFAAFETYCSHTESNISAENMLLAENVEALSQDEHPKKCTKAKETCTCISDKEKGKFMGIAILAIEEYEVTSAVQTCLHDSKTNCPTGSSCRKSR